MNKFFKRCSIGVLIGAIAVVSVISKNNSKASDEVSFNQGGEVKEEDNQQELLEKKLIEQSKVYVQYMIDKEYDKAFDAIDEKAKQYFSIEILEEVGLDFDNAVFDSVHDIEWHEQMECYKVRFSISTPETNNVGSVYITEECSLRAIGCEEYVKHVNVEQNEAFSEEVIKVGALENNQLEGVLTLPTNKEKPPVVILVHGSGYNDYNESYGDNKMFGEIAHGLAKQGIATVRYNERFCQYRYLSESNNTVYTEAIDDAVAIVDQISQDSRIDSENIYVAGHSLGGFVAPKIAELNPKVKGIISLAGSPRNLYELAADKLELIVSREDLSQEEKESYEQTIKEYKELQAMFEEGDEIISSSSSKSYVKSVNELKQEESLNKLDIPMLITHPQDDYQVLMKDFEEWQRILAGRDNCEFKLYDGLNHFYMKSQGYTLSDLNERLEWYEYLVPNNVDVRLINDMAAFINNYSIK